MDIPEVVVVRTGVANLASVLAGLERAGANVHISNDKADIESAERLMLPGVGAFGAGMRQLNEDDLVEPLRQRIRIGKPTLAICLGLQLLCETSEENPGVAGLGVLPAQVTRFGDRVRVPQLGWNRVEPEQSAHLLQPGFAYFANSYRLTACPPGWQASWTDHGGHFVAALERGAVLACQFHPELSGPWGLDLLRRWLALPAQGGALC